jgi:peptidoglycan/LPS O-acetylase OafA/YrhL
VFNTAELVGLSPRWSGVITVVAAPLLAFAVHRAIELPAGRAIRAALAPRRRPDPVARPTLPA